MSDPDEARRLAAELYTSVIAAIVAGARSFCICGLDDVAVELLATLSCGGLLGSIDAVVGDQTSIEKICGVPVEELDAVLRRKLDAIIVTSDASKEKILSRVAKIVDPLGAPFPLLLFAGTRHYEFDDEVYFQTVKSCLVKSKAGGYPDMLIHLYQALKAVAQGHVKGDVAEFGVFQGGTTVFMAKVLAHFAHPAKVIGFDTFSGFPAAQSVLDLYNDSKCEFADYDTVASYCGPYRIELVQGDIAETCGRLSDVDLALSFFDTDNYSAARKALAICAERTVVGGFIVFDHWYSPAWKYTIGERLAAREVLGSAKWWNLHGTGVFLRTPN